MDIDNFKKFNDTHGHIEGDKALVILSEILRNILRASDLAARLGGEEFGLLVACHSIEQLQEVAERTRKSFCAHRFMIDGKSYSSSISIGVGMRDLTEPTSDFINRIDKALYLAKEKGRNQFQVAVPI